MPKKNRIKEEYIYESDSSDESDGFIDELKKEIKDMELDKYIYEVYNELRSSILFPYKWRLNDFYDFIYKLEVHKYEVKKVQYFISDIGEDALDYYVDKIYNIISFIHFSYINEDVRIKIVLYLYRVSTII
jgi:hypothetical protein